MNEKENNFTDSRKNSSKRSLTVKLFLIRTSK